MCLSHPNLFFGAATMRVAKSCKLIVSLVGIGLLVSSSRANARLGETAKQCDKRYGKPVVEQYRSSQSGLPRIGIERHYRVRTRRTPGVLGMPDTWEEIWVTAYFPSERGPCFRLDLAKKASFEGAELAALLEANQGDHAWGDFGEPRHGDSRGAYSEELSYSERTDGAIVERNTLFRYSTDVGRPMPDADRLRIYSSEYLEAVDQRRQQDERQSDENARSRLRGF